MNDCVINNSYSGIGALLYSHDNSGTPSYIFNCQFYENKGDVSLFDLYTASVILYDSIFFNNSNLAFYSIQSNINISNISFSDHVCQNIEGCVFSLSKTSFLFLGKSVFKNVFNLENEGNIVFDSSIVSFENTFMGNFSTLHKTASCARVDSTHLEISEGIFQNFLGNCIFATQSSVKIKNSNFNNQKISNSKDLLYNYGGISCFSCFEFTLQNSSLTNGRNFLSGAGLYLLNEINSKDQTNIFVIFNNSFQNNSAIVGGAISMLNVKALIKLCIFDNNSAQKGGAIFLDGSGNLFSRKK